MSINLEKAFQSVSTVLERLFHPCYDRRVELQGTVTPYRLQLVPELSGRYSIGLLVGLEKDSVVNVPLGHYSAETSHQILHEFNQGEMLRHLFPAAALDAMLPSAKIAEKESSGYLQYGPSQRAEYYPLQNNLYQRDIKMAELGYR